MGYHFIKFRPSSGLSLQIPELIYMSNDFITAGYWKIVTAGDCPKGDLFRAADDLQKILLHISLDHDFIGITQDDEDPTIE